MRIKKDNVSDVVDYVKNINNQAKLLLLAPVKGDSQTSLKEKIKAEALDANLLKIKKGGTLPV